MREGYLPSVSGLRHLELAGLVFEATVQTMSGLRGHCNLRRTVICDTNECSVPAVADIDWSTLNSVHMVMHEFLSTIDEYVEYETSSKNLSMVVVFTDD